MFHRGNAKPHMFGNSLEAIAAKIECFALPPYSPDLVSQLFYSLQSDLNQRSFDFDDPTKEYLTQFFTGLLQSF